MNDCIQDKKNSSAMEHKLKGELGQRKFKIVCEHNQISDFAMTYLGKRCSLRSIDAYPEEERAGALKRRAETIYQPPAHISDIQKSISNEQKAITNAKLSKAHNNIQKNTSNEQKAITSSQGLLKSIDSYPEEERAGALKRRAETIIWGPDEYKALLSKISSDIYKSRSKEENAAIRTKGLKTRANRSKEQKAITSAKLSKAHKKIQKNRSKEQKAIISAKLSKATSKTWANRTKEQKDAFCAKLSKAAGPRKKVKPLLRKRRFKREYERMEVDELPASTYNTAQIVRRLKIKSKKIRRHCTAYYWGWTRRLNPRYRVMQSIKAHGFKNPRFIIMTNFRNHFVSCDVECRLINRSKRADGKKCLNKDRGLRGYWGRLSNYDRYMINKNYGGKVLNSVYCIAEHSG